MSPGTNIAATVGTVDTYGSVEGNPIKLGVICGGIWQTLGRDGEVCPERGWGEAHVSRAKPVSETVEALMIAIEVPSVGALHDPEARFTGMEKNTRRGPWARPRWGYGEGGASRPRGP